MNPSTRRMIERETRIGSPTASSICPVLISVPLVDVVAIDRSIGRTRRRLKRGVRSALLAFSVIVAASPAAYRVSLGAGRMNDRRDAERSGIEQRSALESAPRVAVNSSAPGFLTLSIEPIESGEIDCRPARIGLSGSLFPLDDFDEEAFHGRN